MALENATPQQVWEIYGPTIEEVRLGDTASPVLAWEIPGDDENIYVAEFEIEPGKDGPQRALTAAVEEILKRGHDPCRVLMSGEIWSQRTKDDPIEEAAGFIFTARAEDEKEWMAEAPFARTMEGVVWHYDRFVTITPRDNLTPMLDILRGKVGRFR